jgi:hypothetical protein
MILSDSVLRRARSWALLGDPFVRVGLDGGLGLSLCRRGGVVSSSCFCGDLKDLLEPKAEAGGGVG